MKLTTRISGGAVGSLRIDRFGVLSDGKNQISWRTGVGIRCLSNLVEKNTKLIGMITNRADEVRSISPGGNKGILIPSNGVILLNPERVAIAALSREETTIVLWDGNSSLVINLSLLHLVPGDCEKRSFLERGLGAYFNKVNPSHVQGYICQISIRETLSLLPSDIGGLRVRRRVASRLKSDFPKYVDVSSSEISVAVPGIIKEILRRLGVSTIGVDTVDLSQLKEAASPPRYRGELTRGENLAIISY